MCWIFEEKKVASLLVFLLVLMSGCASRPKEVETLVISSALLNRTEAGRPSPVVVDLLQMKEPKQFQVADYFKLSQMDKPTLPDVLSVEQFVVEPSQAYRLRHSLHAEAKHVGVFAAFQNMDELRWRSVLEVGQALSVGFPLFDRVYAKRLLLCVELTDSGVAMRVLSSAKEMSRLQTRAQESVDGKVQFLGCQE